MTTGERIKKFRIAKGLTQKELGEMVGLSDDRIRHYELNDRKPKKEVLKKIADSLGVNIGCLMGISVYNSFHAEGLIESIVAMYGKSFVFEYLKKLE